MSSGQVVRGHEALVDVELLQPSHALQRFEPFQRHFARARYKLNECGFLRLVVIGKDFSHSYYHLRLIVVIEVLSVGLQVVDVDVRHAGYEQLQLSAVKDAYQSFRNHFVKPRQEVVHLFFDFLAHFGVANGFDVILFVGLRDWDVPSVLNQLNHLDPPELVFFIAEVDPRHTFISNVSVQESLQILKELWVEVLHVGISDGLS